MQIEAAAAIDQLSNKEISYDEYCKKVLMNKYVLSHISRHVITEFKGMSIKEVLTCLEPDTKEGIKQSEKINGMNTEDITGKGGLVRYDVLCGLGLPNHEGKVDMFMNIEAQGKDNMGYPLLKRSIYYGSRLLVRQKNTPNGFQKTNYEDLKKVYSIWICMKHSKKKSGVMNRYSLHEEHLGAAYAFPRRHYDLMNIIMIYPPKEVENIHDGTFMTLLYILFTSGMDSTRKKEILTKNYGIPMTKELGKELEEMCNLSQYIKEEGILQGRKEGRREGRIEGIVEGVEKGKVEEKMDIANKMKEKGYSTKEIEELTGILLH